MTKIGHFLSSAILAMALNVALATPTLADKPFVFTPITDCDSLEMDLDDALNAADAGDAAKAARSLASALRKHQAEKYKCTDRKFLNYLSAEARTINGRISLLNGNLDQAKHDLDVANELLENCVVDYYGKDRSATCKERLEDNIRRIQDASTANP